MKDDIKEILNRLEKIGFYASVSKELVYMTTNITPQECKTTLDYITNLQEENERLNNENKQYKEYIKELKNSLKNYHIKNNKLINENNRLNNIIKNLDKMFECYFLGNLKYNQDTVSTIYIKYVKLKELESKGE